MTLEEQFISRRKEIQTYLFHKTNRDKELSEDLFQELYLKLRKIADSGKYVEEGKFMNFIRRIAGNMTIDHYRQTSKFKIILNSDFQNDVFQNRVTKRCNDLWDQHYHQEEEEYQDTFVTPEMREKLSAAMSKLPIAQKELVTMRFFRNMPYKDIVLETGEKQSNLLPRMFHAKKNLKKFYNE